MMPEPTLLTAQQRSSSKLSPNSDEMNRHNDGNNRTMGPCPDPSHSSSHKSPSLYGPGKPRLSKEQEVVVEDIIHYRPKW